jgi:hypothetical protein
VALTAEASQPSKEALAALIAARTQPARSSEAPAGRAQGYQGRVIKLPPGPPHLARHRAAVQESGIHTRPADVLRRAAGRVSADVKVRRTRGHHPDPPQLARLRATSRAGLGTKSWIARSRGAGTSATPRCLVNIGHHQAPSEACVNSGRENIGHLARPGEHRPPPELTLACLMDRALSRPSTTSICASSGFSERLPISLPLHRPTITVPPQMFEFDLISPRCHGRPLLLYARVLGSAARLPIPRRYIDWTITVPPQMFEFYLNLSAVPRPSTTSICASSGIS